MAIILLCLMLKSKFINFSMFLLISAVEISERTKQFLYPYESCTIVKEQRIDTLNIGKKVTMGGKKRKPTMRRG